MRNFLSKSHFDFDLLKISNNIQLMLTEQRAQRVDLARTISLIRKLLDDRQGLEESDEVERGSNPDSEEDST